jgi:lipopolysaccharide transport system ATP-binding protein
MSKPMISVQDLGKRYILKHQTGGKSPQYRRLSEELASGLRGLLKKKEKSQTANSREEFWALDGVSFDIHQGEVVGIIGRNGAGKSTLLKLLSRITDPSKGRFELHGRVAALLEVGTGFHPELTGRENIFLNGAVLGMHRSEIRSKFDEIVDFSGVEKFLDTPVKRFSSGMSTRLAFSIAAHLDPEILIIDEVLAVGDYDFQRKCLGKMKEVSKSGRTVLFVSHNLSTVASLTSRCIYLQSGKVVSDAPTEQAIREYVGAGANQNAIYVSHEGKRGPHVSRAEVKTSLSGSEHRMLDPLSIEIEVTTDVSVPNCCLQCIVVDPQRHVATAHFHLLSDHTQRFADKPGTYRLTCHVSSARLFMGNYHLVTHLREPAGGRKFESISDICHFRVSPMERQREMIPYADGEATYIEDWKWEIETI